MCPLHRLLMTEQTDLNVQLAAVGEGRHPPDKGQYQTLSETVRSPPTHPGCCPRAVPLPQSCTSSPDWSLSRQKVCPAGEVQAHRSQGRGAGQERLTSSPAQERCEAPRQSPTLRHSPSSTKLLLPNTAAEMCGGCVSPRGRGGQASTSRGRVVTGSLITHTATTSPPVILPPTYRLFYLRGFP